jgi:hypothetical protein
MARSTDGGATFKNFKISQSPFVPIATIFFGDYNNLSVHNGIVRPIWTRMDSGRLSVWTALVDTTQLSEVITSVPVIAEQLQQLESYPNPFTNQSFVSFKLRKPALVSIAIYDIAGRLVSQPVKSRRYPPGKYIEKIDAAAAGISPGAYVYTILVNNKLYSRKMLRVE